MNTPHDPRLGLPSGSGYHRWRRCFGSHALSQKVSSEILDADLREAADIGTRRHGLVANEDATVEHEDEYHVERAKYLKAQYIENSGITVEETIREQRFYLNDSNGNPIASGQIDEAVIGVNALGMKTAILFDYKMAYGNHGEAKTNEQLAMYAVLIRQAYPTIDYVYGVLIQPSLPTDKQCTDVYYDTKTLEVFESEIRAILKIVATENAPRYPGEVQCKFCKAKGICPEATAVAMVGVQEIGSAANIHTLSGITLRDYYKKAKQAEAVAKNLKELVAEEVKQRILAGQEVEGFTLANEKTRRSITNPNAAFASALAIGIPQDEFMTAVSISVTELDKLHKKYAGVKAKDAKEDFEKRFGDCIERKQDAPTLKAD